MVETSGRDEKMEQRQVRKKEMIKEIREVNMERGGHKRRLKKKSGLSI